MLTLLSSGLGTEHIYVPSYGLCAEVLVPAEQKSKPSRAHQVGV